MISKATLGRVPTYLNYLKSLPNTVENISATIIARELGLGEVQVRKDLGALCGYGKPRLGYSKDVLISCLDKIVSSSGGDSIVIGAGKLGRAILDYTGFAEYGLTILAAFDKKVKNNESSPYDKDILPMDSLEAFCKEHNIKIGIIAVPGEAAQSVCDRLYACGIRAMWCFAPCKLNAPEDAVIQYENMALSLAHLKMQISN